MITKLSGIKGAILAGTVLLVFSLFGSPLWAKIKLFSDTSGLKISLSKQNTDLKKIVEKMGRVPKNLLQKRKEAMHELMKKDPKAAVELALDSSLRNRLSKDLKKWVEERGTFEGIFLAVVADDFENKTGQTSFFLKYKNQWEPLYPSEIPAGALSGAQVRVEGIYLEGGSIASKALTLLGAPPPVLPLFNEKKIAIFLVDFNDTVPIASDKISRAEEVYCGNEDSVKKFYEEASYNQITFSCVVDGIIQAPFSRQDITLYNDAIWDYVTNEAAAHVDLNDVDYEVILYRRQGDFVGQNTIGAYGALSLGRGLVRVESLDGALPYHICGHELGHGLGWWHSGQWFNEESQERMPDDLNDPGPGWSIDVYADSYEIMGSGWMNNPLSAFHRNKAGWLSDENILVAEPSQGNTYTLYRIDLGGDHIKQIKVPVGDSHFYSLEQVRAGAWGETSVILLRHLPSPGKSGLWAVDTLEPAMGFELNSGMTFEDPDRNIHISVSEITEDHASVYVGPMPIPIDDYKIPDLYKLK